MTEFEKLGGTYRQAGDYYLPNLEIDNQIEVQIGVWGRRHRRFLKEKPPGEILQSVDHRDAERLSC